MQVSSSVPCVDEEAAVRALGALFRNKRNELGLKQDTVAAAIKIRSPYLSRIENGIQAPGPERARKLADYLGIDFGEVRPLLRAIRDSRLPPDLQDEQRMRVQQVSVKRDPRLRPVIGKAACGPWIEALESGGDPAGEKYRFPVPKHHKLQDRRAFWVEAEGDSMTGSGIEQGAYLLVERVAPTNGQHALVQIDGKVTVKKWLERSDRYLLVATNPNYKPQEVTVWKSEYDDRVGWAWAITLVQPPARPPS